MFMALTDTSLLETVLSHYVLWHVDNAGCCGFLMIILSIERRPWWPAGEPFAVSTDSREYRFSTSLKGLKGSRLSQVVAVPVLFSLKHTHRLKMSKNKYGVESFSSPTPKIISSSVIGHLSFDYELS